MKFLPIPIAKAKLLGARRLAKIHEAVRAGEWPTDDEVIRAILSVPTHFGDLSITATLVVPPTSGAVIAAKKIIGETLLAGQWVYEKAADSNRLWKGQCDGTAAEYTVLGVVLNGGAIGQAAQYQSSGKITIGGTGVVSAEYYLSATFGAMCLRTDLVSTNRVIKLGYFETATLFVIEIKDLGVAVP